MNRRHTKKNLTKIEFKIKVPLENAKNIYGYVHDDVPTSVGGQSVRTINRLSKNVKPTPTAKSVFLIFPIMTNSTSHSQKISRNIMLMMMLFYEMRRF